MSVIQVPTSCGYELVNTDWTDADRAFFNALKAAGLPVNYDIKQALHRYVSSSAPGQPTTGRLVLTEGSGGALILL